MRRGMDAARPRRWYQVVSQALLDAAVQYQQCRTGDAGESPYLAGGTAPS
ncbi:MAG: hypothetical protein ACRD0S_01535 [Acidimicrobiales bacterium]